LIEHDLSEKPVCRFAQIIRERMARWRTQWRSIGAASISRFSGQRHVVSGALVWPGEPARRFAARDGL
jgi:hypothetical protein